MKIRKTEMQDYLKKPTYYLWRALFTSEEEYESEKERYRRAGYRVVTFEDKGGNQRIADSLNTIAANHYSEIREEAAYECGVCPTFTG